jgi:hypothetical protein
MQLSIRADETIMLPVYTDFEICPMTTVTTLRVTVGPWTGLRWPHSLLSYECPRCQEGYVKLSEQIDAITTSQYVDMRGYSMIKGIIWATAR